jgi:hypothetical protein
MGVLFLLFAGQLLILIFPVKFLHPDTVFVVEGSHSYTVIIQIKRVGIQMTLIYSGIMNIYQVFVETVYAVISVAFFRRWCMRMPGHPKASLGAVSQYFLQRLIRLRGP